MQVKWFSGHFVKLNKVRQILHFLNGFLHIQSITTCLCQKRAKGLSVYVFNLPTYLPHTVEASPAPFSPKRQAGKLLTRARFKPESTVSTAAADISQNTDLLIE